MAKHTNGFVYATTGSDYTALARRSARNLRQLMPDAQIDLFTDQPLKDRTFNRIIPLSKTWFRPKMEALLRTRFHRTVLLDADTIPVMDLSDLFASVDRCDLAGCMSTGRPMAMYRSQPEIPRSFPYINAGMLVVKRTRRMHALVREWEQMVRVNNLPKDQPTLRWLLYHRKLPFHVLPLEYNLVHIALLDSWETFFETPRLLHVQALHSAPPGNPTRPFNLIEVLGESRAAVIHKRRRQERFRNSLADSTFPNVTGLPLPWFHRANVVARSAYAVIRRSYGKTLSKLRLRQAPGKLTKRP